TLTSRARLQQPCFRRPPDVGGGRLSGFLSNLAPGAWHLKTAPDACLVVRNRIYARVFDRGWVAQHMPDAELRRQKTAFRRGLLRAASVAGVVVTLMSFLVLQAVGQTHRAEAASVKADREATSAKALARRLQVALHD